MTTNTNPSRTAARFFASATPVASGLYTITDRTDGIIVAHVKGRAAARTMAATLTAIDPTDAQGPDAKPAKARKAKAAKAEPKATAHADCAHAATKLARAICRRERAKAEAPADAKAEAPADAKADA